MLDNNNLTLIEIKCLSALQQAKEAFLKEKNTHTENAISLQNKLKEMLR